MKMIIKSLASKHILSLIVYLLITILVSCGGGSVGTGSRIISGNISDDSGAPIALALVTISETGEQDQTNQNGDFSIQTSSETADLSLLVESNGIEDKITIDKSDGQPDNSERTNVDLRVDKKSKKVTKVKSLSVTAKIVGKCDSAFENNSTIRQSNKLANGTECTLKVKILGDSKPLGDIPFVLQHRECDATKSWIESVRGLTKVVTTPGIAQVNFIFKTDSSHCEYRVVAPYKFSGLGEVIFPIETFQSQLKSQSDK